MTVMHAVCAALSDFSGASAAQDERPPLEPTLVEMKHVETRLKII